MFLCYIAVFWCYYTIISYYIAFLKTCTSVFCNVDKREWC